MLNFRLPPVPGLRVKPQDDVPGFNIDENGLPRSERTWSDGTPPGMTMPPGVTPVNCTTANGRLDCLSPGGIKFNERAPPRFPERLEPGVEDYHRYSVPDGPYSAPEQTLRQHIIDYPTPGPRHLVRPATPEGTLNEATPPQYYYPLLTALAASGVYPPGMLISPVRSYLKTDQNGNQIVVNITEPNHGLHPGYVLRYVTPSENGATIQNEGEGTALLQGNPFAQRWGLADDINGVWHGLYGEQTGRGKKQP